MNTGHAVWTRPALATQVLRRRRDGRAEVALRAPTLATPHQALRVEQQLRGLPGVGKVDVDTVARRLRVMFDDAATPLPRLLDACSVAGCVATPLAHASLDDALQRAADESLKRLLVAGIFAMQAMMFAFVLYIGVVDAVDTLTLQLFRWLGMLSAAPVVGYAALPFYRHALAGLRAGRPGIDVPVALAVLAIYAGSALATVRGVGEVYFDSVSMFVFVLLLGRHLELRARQRHGALGDAAADAAPLVAERRSVDGRLETVAATELVRGDRVHVAEGAVVPADGRLENARVRIDASLLSGESRPRTCRHGDALAAGSVVLDGPAELRVERPVAESTMARLGALAGAGRVPADPRDASTVAARRFVLRVLTLALATAAFWLWRDPARAFDATVAVLVVACPCAFGLAAPATLTRAMSVLARHGVLVARPAALQALARADRVLFDKTGTLTEPALDPAHIDTFRGIDRKRALRLAAALARESTHPLARAVARQAGTMPLPAASDIEVVASGGIRGRIDGRRLRLGRIGFACDAHADDDDALWLADDDGPLARLVLDESLRRHARDSVDALGRAGLVPAIISGDSPARVRDVAARLRVDEWHARQSPHDKHARVCAERDAGACVLVVGDGSNDAAALAAADVSATLPGGTDLARGHADLLLSGGLAGLPLAQALAARAAHVLRQNRRWALVYNLCAVPFAALGLVSPWLAALGMSLSSLGVVLNALRLKAPTAPPTMPRLQERMA